MGDSLRRAVYARQNGFGEFTPPSHIRFTSRQAKRLRHKLNRLNKLLERAWEGSGLEKD